MADLSSKTLGELCDLGGGEVKTGPFGSQLHQSDYTAEGTPVVMPKNIVTGNVSTQGIARIGSSDVERLGQHRLAPGDIVYGRRGDIGRHAFITGRETGWLCGTGCLRITLGDGPLEARFLHYYLEQEGVIAWIRNQAVGATMPNLNMSILRRVLVRYPSRDVQRKIVSVLSASDDLIENNTRRIAILEEIAQALYREWFVKFRFPGHENVRMVKSPLGDIPENWRCSRLGDVCMRITDGSHSSPKSVSEGYPMASVKDMDDWGISEDTCRRIAKIDYDRLVRNDCRPLVNDVLIAKDGSYLKHAFVVVEDHELVILSSIAILRSRLDEIDPNLLCFCLRQPEARDRLAGYVSGVAIPRIVLKDFSKFLIPVPDLGLQLSFMEAVEPTLRLLRVLLQKNVLLRSARNLLLPRLVCGELDVSELDIKPGEEAA